MKLVARLAAIALLAWLVAPEISRYRAERRIGIATAALISTLGFQKPSVSRTSEKRTGRIG